MTWDLIQETARRPSPRPALVAIGFATLACVASPATAARFNGFQDAFNLGLSPTTNLVCAAARTYDVAAASVRAWSISCRGLGDRVLGTVYSLHGPKKARAAAAWAERIVSGYECGDVAGAMLVRPGSHVCTDRTSGVQYRVEARAGHDRQILVVGNRAIEDLLTVAADYTAGRIDEPDARKVANYNGISVSSVDLAEILGQASGGNAASEFRKAYQLNYDWNFERAEDTFSTLAKASFTENKYATQVESLYNLALNASNNKQDDYAQFVFEQAEKESSEQGLEVRFKGLSLNYQAILQRNKGSFAQAKDTALAAVDWRAKSAAGGPFQRDGDHLTILAGEQDVDNGKLSDRDRNALLDVQAYQVAATCLEAMGEKAAAAGLLNTKAVPILRRYGETGTGFKSRPLGEAVPWLNLRVQADALRLNRLVGEKYDLVAFRAALDAFGRIDPASLPLAGSIMELASAEASVRDQQEQALKDYETAFGIFREKRGSLGPSADFAAGYFQILLDRIDVAGGDRSEAIQRFFIAAQALTSQSSVRAARHANAQRDTADPQTALLARQFETAEAEVEAQKQAFLSAQARKDADAASEAQAEQARLAQDAQKLLDKLSARDPSYAGRLETNIDLAELQRKLLPGEAYIKVFLLSKQGFGIFITHDSALPYPIALSLKDGRCLVETFRSSLSNNPKVSDWDAGCKIAPVREVDEHTPYRFDIDAAGQLFDSVFGPVRAMLLKATSLIYEPDATLIGAPISAMVVDRVASLKALENNQLALTLASKSNPASQGGKRPRLSYVGVDWLGEHAPNAVALDPTTFVRSRDARPSNAHALYLGFGEPVIIHDPKGYANLGGGKTQCQGAREVLSAADDLPDTAVEVRDVSTFLGGPPLARYRLNADFNDAWITKTGSDIDLKDFKILYFATHGILEPDDPCLGVALLTSVSPDGGDGLLDVDKILHLQLDADLVVLSACNTALTKGGGSEAVGGLFRSFLIASARNLVVSNWSVDSGPTARLMKTMFGARGRSQAEALNFAERDMAHDGAWSHPYFWAGFSIVGDGAKAIPSANAPGAAGGE